VSAPASSVQRSNVEDEWVELWDASTQAHYYYNVATQESSWTKPAVAAGHESEVRGSVKAARRGVFVTRTSIARDTTLRAP
jgi:hypothetical protein